MRKFLFFTSLVGLIVIGLLLYRKMPISHKLEVAKSTKIHIKPATTETFTIPQSEMSELNPEADAKYLNQIESVFGGIALTSSDPDQIAPYLSKLNAMGAKGLKIVTDKLSAAAITDEAVRQRIYLVDYLNYRLRWDSAAKEEAIHLASMVIPDSTPIRYKAAAIAEKAEIIEALAKTDWQAATKLIATSTIPQVRRLASSAAYYHLIEQGYSKQDALLEVRTFNSDFKL